MSDHHRAPDPALLADCVHCGFCLPACPTYQLWGQEMDSPRGRIWLMSLANGDDAGQANGEDAGQTNGDDAGEPGGATQAIPSGAALAEYARHIDACLGCLACETACPSGVRYGALVEAARAQIDHAHRRSLADGLLRALLFAFLPHPRRLRAAARLGALYRRSGARGLLHRLGIATRLPRRLRAIEALLPTGGPDRRRPAATLPANGEQRRSVSLLQGCAGSVWFGRVIDAACDVLTAEGCAVRRSSPSRCCGALSLHAGRVREAQRLARATIAALDGDGIDHVVVTAAGCGSAMKGYDRLLADDGEWAERAAAFASRVVDVSELLADLTPRATRHAVPARVAYQDACHLAHGQGVRRQPRALLAAIPGVELVELADGDGCCGSAGIYNVLEPDAAEALGARKADGVRAVAPDVLATGNPGCAMQLARHLGGAVAVYHPVELLAASLAGRDPLPATRGDPMNGREPRAGRPPA